MSFRATLPAVAMLAACHGFATAETRFLNLSVDTVGGRKVRAVNGITYTFFKDGSFEWRDAQRTLKGRWKLSSKSIVVTYRNGEYWNYGAFVDQGGTYLTFQSGRVGRAVTRVVSIEPAQ